MMGEMRVWRGFDVNNPQHLVWLKRKLHRKERYERQFARRRPSGLKTFKRCARYLQSRQPPYSYWWNKLIAMERNAITGRPILKRRIEWWNEAHNAHAKEERK